jgi:transposase
MNMMTERTYSIREAAEAFGINYQTLRSAAATGDVETIKLGGADQSPRYLTEAALDDWIERVKARGGTLPLKGDEE